MKRICVQAIDGCHECEPLSRSVLLSLQVLFKFSGPRCCHGDEEDFPWRTILVLVRYQLEFKPLAALSATRHVVAAIHLWL